MTAGLTRRKKTKSVVIHCSASPPNVKTGVKDIDRWHRQRGFMMVGYHWVIKTDGEIQEGRDEDFVGAHVGGYNHDSIGICLIGGVDKDLKPENNFSKEQMLSLLVKLKEIREKYPQINILGHRDYPGVAKACPSFDVKPWAKGVGL